MAWTTNRTWVSGELVTAAIMNTYVRDNLNTISGWTNHTPTLKGVTVDPTLSSNASHTAEGEYIEFGGDVVVACAGSNTGGAEREIEHL